MTKSDAVIAAIGAAGGGILAFVGKSRTVGMAHWETFASAALGAFLGALWFLSIAFMLSQIRKDPAQRQRFLLGALAGTLLALSVLFLGAGNERSLTYSLSLILAVALACAMLFLLNGERKEVPDRTFFLSILLGGYIALLTALLFNIDTESYDLVLVYGIIIGAFGAKTIDFFFG